MFLGLKCHRPLDVVLALDASGRTRKEDWETVVKFCKELLRGLNPISERQNRLGILTFDELPRVAKELNKKTDIREIQKVIDGLHKTQLSGMTFTDEALKEASNIFQRSKGVREASKVLIVFYDGKTTDRLGKKGFTFNKRAVTMLRKDDVKTFVVEFGRFIGEEDILTLVSDPKLEHIYTLNDMPELARAVQTLSWRAC